MTRDVTVVSVTPAFYVAVVDRYLTFADTLAAGLRAEPDILDATALTSTASLWQTLRYAPVDVVLMDSELIGADGHSFLQQVREEYPQTKLVVLSENVEPHRAAQVLASGAAGWLPKNLPLHELMQGLRAVVDGQTWVPGKFLAALLRATAAPQDENREPTPSLELLTGRERQILQCMVNGLSRPQIAEHLGMSPNTVRTHVHNLLHKLGAHSSIRAVAIAREAGLATTDLGPAVSHPRTCEHEG